jgi:Tfp pilus assembly protein PilN
MRAVNLIPRESRRGAGGVAGRSGGAAYALLAVLALLVIGAAVYVLTDNTIAARRAELAKIETQTSRATAQAAAVAPYQQFAALAQARVDTVRGIASSRFDWDHAFTELSKVIPSNVWLTSLLATVAPGVSVSDASSGSTGGLRAAVSAPAIEMTGCTNTHDDVARLITRLGLIHGVTHVSLADSSKLEGNAGAGAPAPPSTTTGANGASGSGAGVTGDCRHGKSNVPQFDMVVFFNPPPSAPAPAAAGATGTPAAATAATPSATPAASTTPGSTGATPGSGATP